MKKALFVWIMLLSGVGNATLIDLGDYLLDTGSYNRAPDQVFDDKYDENGTYKAFAAYGNVWSPSILITLTGSNQSFVRNSSELSDYKKVKNPYPGYLKINSTTDNVIYLGQVNDNLSLSVISGSSEQVINLLKNLKVISRADYQKLKSKELMDSLN